MTLYPAPDFYKSSGLALTIPSDLAVNSLTINGTTTVVGVSNDTTLAADAIDILPTQHAVKHYVDNSVSPTASAPIYKVAGNYELHNTAATTVTAISIDGTMAANTDLAIPTQKAVRSYVSNNYYNPVNQLVVTDTTNSTTPLTGSIRTLGGLGVKLDAHIGGQLTAHNGLVVKHDPGSRYISLTTDDPTDTGTMLFYTYTANFVGLDTTFLSFNRNVPNYLTVPVQYLNVGNAGTLTLAGTGGTCSVVGSRPYLDISAQTQVRIMSDLYIDGSVTTNNKNTYLGFAGMTLTNGGGNRLDNQPLPTNGTLVRIINNSTDNIDITGFSGGVSGRMIILIYDLYNGNAFTIKLKNASINSLAVNRIQTPNGGDLTLDPNAMASCTLIYDTTVNFWLITNSAP